MSDDNLFRYLKKQFYQNRYMLAGSQSFVGEGLERPLYPFPTGYNANIMYLPIGT